MNENELNDYMRYMLRQQELNDMNGGTAVRSQETLRRVELNDSTLTNLQIGDHPIYYVASYGGVFLSSNGDGYSRLGELVGRNTHLTTLDVEDVGDELSALELTNSQFFDGLKNNTSIHTVDLDNNRGNNIRTLVGRVGHGILDAYQENGININTLHISYFGLQNGGESVVATALRSCINLKTFSLTYGNVTDGQLLPIVEALRGHCLLEDLSFVGNRLIGDRGCKAVATLFDEQTFNVQKLSLHVNRIGIEGVTAIINRLGNNSSLDRLNLDHDLVDQNLFSNLICNTSSINSIYSSNHVLESIWSSPKAVGAKLSSLLTLNKNTNKSHVAVKKILLYHPIIDVESLFDWDMEVDRSLKALPFLVSWFQMVVEALADEEDYGNYRVAQMKLSAIYQFAKATPLLFVPSPTIKKNDNKRKRDDRRGQRTK